MNPESGDSAPDRSEPGPSSDVDTESVHCPRCQHDATMWTDDELVGIECPHCGHVEAFHGDSEASRRDMDDGSS